MNKINKFIFGFVGLALFAGCSDLTGSKTSDLQENAGYIVNGNLSFGSASGAVPSQFVSYASSARTATASFSDDIAWEISAAKGEKSYAPLNYTSGSTFSFLFDEAGEYTIEARAVKDDTIIASGSEKVSVTEKETSSITIAATPKYTTALGSVNLEMSFDSAVAEKLSSVEVEWIGLEDRAMTVLEALGYDREAANTAIQNNEEYTPPAEVLAAMDALESWSGKCSEGKFNKSVSVSGTSATISIDGIFCGAHSVEFKFIDKKGNTIYSCKEMVNVYSGFVTDTWYGTAPYLSDGNFKLSWDRISAYGVAKGDIALYDNIYGEVNYYLSDTLKVDLSQKPDFTADSVKFCFDANGNFYAITGNNTDGTTISSAVFTDVDVLIDPLESGLGNYGITVDVKENILYAWWCNEATLNLIKYPNLISSRGADISCNEYTISYGNMHYLESIYDGVCYDISDYSGYKLSQIIIPTESGSIPSANKTELITDFNSILGLHEKEQISVNDMLYMDGNLYLLVSESGKNEVNGFYYSRGGVIKYNIGSEETEIRGFSSEKKENTEMTDVGAYLYYDGQSKLYEDPERKKPLVVKGNEPLNSGGETVNSVFPNICTPAPFAKELSTTAFYGPSKIIAIKPKKLIIADSGIAFYVNDDGAFSYKNVNRIVTVNLDDFALAGVSDTNVFFDNGTEIQVGEHISNADTVFFPLYDRFSEIKFYYSKEGEYTMGTVYVGIKPEAEE